jgi:hypothetical protein
MSDPNAQRRTAEQSEHSERRRHLCGSRDVSPSMTPVGFHDHRHAEHWMRHGAQSGPKEGACKRSVLSGRG